MTLVNSWIQLDSTTDELQLSQEIRNDDAFQGIDIGWVSQMRPFIREFSKPGDLILEPFAGIGTSLIAAQLEKRSSIGIEIEHPRIKLIENRWQECCFNKADLNVIQGDCVSVLSKLVESKGKPFVDLCITSVPYFGSEWQGNKEEAQLYSKSHYTDYMNHMKQLFFILKNAMKNNGYLVFMAENTRKKDGTLLPIAWDLGKALAKYFSVYDERIITYLKTFESPTKPENHTNRAHEYALVVKNEEVTVSLKNGTDFLNRLNKRGFNLKVYGSFSALLKGENRNARDIDIVMPDETVSKIEVLTNLLTDGFDIFCNGHLVNEELLEKQLSNLIEKRYFRCLAADQIKQLDIVFLEKSEFDKIETVKVKPLINNLVAKENIKLNENWKVLI